MANRFERTPRKGIYFTKRDGAIVQAVYTARYLSTRQIARLFFEGKLSSSCKKRIRYLFDAGYLRKRQVNQSESDIYYLGLQGRHYIAKTEINADPKIIEQVAGVAGGGELPSLMMSHELTLSGLYVSAVMQCCSHNLNLEWQNARLLELAKLGVQPDAYLRVSGDAVKRRGLIEFTAVLPSKSEMGKKLAGYKSLLEQRGGVPILWFTTSKSKLEYLLKATKGWLYQDYILFGLIEDCSEFLTKPIWRWSEQKEPVPFISLKM